MTLAQRLLELHARLSKAGIEHAFGGAIALAYWTLEPRGTRDIDINLFVPAADSERALAALPEAIAHDRGTVERIARDGQIRLWWDDVPRPHLRLSERSLRLPQRAAAMFGRGGANLLPGRSGLFVRSLRLPGRRGTVCDRQRTSLLSSRSALFEGAV